MDDYEGQLTDKLLGLNWGGDTLADCVDKIIADCFWVSHLTASSSEALFSTEGEQQSARRDLSYRTMARISKCIEQAQKDKAIEKPSTIQLMPGQNVCSKSTDRVVSVRLEVSMELLRGVIGRTFTFKALREDLQNRAQAVELDIVEVIR